MTLLLTQACVYSGLPRKLWSCCMLIRLGWRFRFNHSGISVNIQDLAPSCAGFLFGVANTAGALAGVVGVCLSGYLIETTGSWTCVFHLVAIISNLGLGTFLVFGKAQRVDLVPTHEDL